MPLLFSYGTLQDTAVQIALFGRSLVGNKDALLSYSIGRIRVADPGFARTSGSAEHAILRPCTDNDARVEGTALEVSDDELPLADSYEPV